jgi:hypothetical protein
MNKHLLAAALSVAAGLALSANSVQAASIGISFMGDDDADGNFILKPEMKAGVVPQGNWNNVPSYMNTPNWGEIDGLKDDSGQTTAVSLLYQANDAWHSDGPSDTPDDKLMKGTLKASAPGYDDPAPGIPAGTMHLTLNDLPSGNYDVYLYCSENGSGAEGDFTVG